MRTASLAIVLLLQATALAAPEQPTFAGKPLAHWIGLLKDENPLLREEAVAVLGEMGAPARAALPNLLPLLKAPDGRLRLRAAASVWKIERQAKDVLPALLESLRNSDRDRRQQAMRLLELLGTSALPAAPDLVTVLDDDDAQMRALAGSALRQMGVNAVPALTAGLKKNDVVGRSQCVQLLHPFASINKQVSDALAERLKDTDKKVRLEAARALLTNRPHRKEVVATLTEAAKDRDPLHRRLAVTSVFMVSPRPRELLEVFAGLLDDPDPVVASNAAMAVWELSKDAKRIVPTLNRVLKDGTSATMFAASITLRQMGRAALPCLPTLLNGPSYDINSLGEIVRQIGPDALPDLLAAVSGGHASPMTHRKAIEVLGYAGPEALPLLLKIMNDPKALMRDSAVRSVGALGPKAKVALPTLLKLAAEKDVNLRAAAFASLGKLGVEGKPAVPLLLASLKDQQVNIRYSALTALAQVPLDPKTAVPALDEEIKSETIAYIRFPALQLRMKLDTNLDSIAAAVSDMLKEPSYQQQLFTLLGKLGPKAQAMLPALVELAKNETRSPYAQVPLINALAEIDPPGKTIAPALTRFLRDRDHGVRKAALTQLAKIGQECDVTTMIGDLRTNDILHRRAIHQALRQLGPKAKGATPTLLELVRGAGGPARFEAAETLCKVAPDQADVGKRVLLDALGDGPMAKFEIARSLLAVDGKNERALKVFETALKRDDVRLYGALNALGQADTSARGVLPFLKPLLKDHQPPVRIWSARAYWKVSGETAPVVAVYLAALQDKSVMSFHTTVLQFLGELGTGAKSAVPALTALLNEKPPRLRPQALDALRRIDPDAARLAERP